MEQVAFVISTVNEAGSIGRVIDLIPADDLRKGGYETAVYVIDGLSVDKTTISPLKKAHKLY
jgi:hypothetical protein